MFLHVQALEFQGYIRVRAGAAVPVRIRCVKGASGNAFEVASPMVLDLARRYLDPPGTHPSPTVPEVRYDWSPRDHIFLAKGRQEFSKSHLGTSRISCPLPPQCDAKMRHDAYERRAGSTYLPSEVR